MAVLQTSKLSNRTVAALPVERDTVFWDRELTGFGVRVYPTGGKVFVAQARGPDGPDIPHKGRRITVGRHPVLSAEQARQRAALIIARVKTGEEPVPLPLPAKYAKGPTVTDLATRDLEKHIAVRCKPKTQRTARGVVNRHIVPALRRLPLQAVERSHVMAMHCLLRSDAGDAALPDRELGADCVHHARMFFDRPDYDLASAVPGSFAITPTATMVRALENDYVNTTAMIFGAAPAFEEILASIQEIEIVVNGVDRQ